MSPKTKKRSESQQDWEDGERFGYHTIIRISLPLNLFILCYQYGDNQNSLILTKRRSNEGLSISVDWLVNLGIMSILKALGLATVSLCVNFSSCPLLKSWWLRACALKMYSNRFIYWGKCSFSLQVTIDPLVACIIHSWPHILLVNTCQRNTGCRLNSQYLSYMSSLNGKDDLLWLCNTYLHIM